MNRQLPFILLLSHFPRANNEMSRLTSDSGAFHIDEIPQFNAEPEILYLILIDSNYNVSGLRYPTILTTVVTSKHMDISFQKAPMFFTRHILSIVNVIFLVGNVFLEQNHNTGNQLCRTSHFPFVCSIHFADKQFVVVSTENSQLKRENFVTKNVAPRSQLKIPMLFFWENGRHVENVAILSTYGNASQLLRFHGFPAEVHAEYQRELRIPAPCYLEEWARDDRIVESPFQKSTQEELHELRCTGRRFAGGTVRVSKVARLQHGQFYPDWGNLVLGERTPGLAIISSEGVRRRFHGTSPFIAPFRVLTWCAIGALLLVLGIFLTASSAELGAPVNTLVSFLSNLCWIGSVFIGQVNFIQLRPVPATALLPTVYLAAMLLTSIYMCALSSEFTVTTVSELPIDCIEELSNFTVILVFGDKTCAAVNEYKSLSQSKTSIGGMICRSTRTDTTLCKFVDRMRKASQGLAHARRNKNYEYYLLKEKFESIEKIESNLNFTCTSAIPDIIKNVNEMNKVAFLTSQENFATTWGQFLKLMENSSLQFGHKLDEEASYFRPPTWTHFDPFLKVNQEWIWRRLEALRSSGITGLWRKWELMNATVLNARADEISSDSQSSVKAIKLSGSWLEDVFLGITMAWGICSVVFLSEICKIQKLYTIIEPKA